LGRPFDGTAVAGSAKPNGVAAQDLVLEIGTHQGHDLARGEIHVDAQRTRPGTRATLDATGELITARHTHNLLAEAWDSVGVVLNRALDFHPDPALLVYRHGLADPDHTAALFEKRA
jgi:hypothetical protein